jgi:hypothetical protein
MEIIDKVTKFIILEEHIFQEDEGNTSRDSILESIKIFDKFYSNIIFEENLRKYFEINFEKFDDVEIFVSNVMEMKYTYIPISIPGNPGGHLIGLFLYKKSPESFDISIINSGFGCNFHGVFEKVIDKKTYEFCNGIILYENINKENIKEFLTYVLFLIETFKGKNSKLFTVDKIKTIFYNSFYEKIMDFDENKTVINFEVPTQLIGDCSFKSFVYCYILLDYYNITSQKKMSINECIGNFWKNYLNIFIEKINQIFKDLENISYEKNKLEGYSNDMALLYIIKDKYNKFVSLCKYYNIPISNKEEIKEEIKKDIAKNILNFNEKLQKFNIEYIDNKLNDFNYMNEIADDTYHNESYESINLLENLSKSMNEKIELDKKYDNLDKKIEETKKKIDLNIENLAKKEYEKKMQKYNDEIERYTKQGRRASPYIREPYLESIIEDMKRDNINYIELNGFTIAYLYNIYENIFFDMYSIFKSKGDINKVKKFYRFIMDLKFNYIEVGSYFNRIKQIEIQSYFMFLINSIIIMYDKNIILEKSDTLFYKCEFTKQEKKINDELIDKFMKQNFNNIVIITDKYNDIIKDLFIQLEFHLKENNYNIIDFTDKISSQLVNELKPYNSNLNNLVDAYKKGLEIYGKYEDELNKNFDDDEKFQEIKNKLDDELSKNESIKKILNPYENNRYDTYSDDERYYSDGGYKNQKGGYYSEILDSLASKMKPIVHKTIIQQQLQDTNFMSLYLDFVGYKFKNDEYGRINKIDLDHFDVFTNIYHFIECVNNNILDTRFSYDLPIFGNLKKNILTEYESYKYLIQKDSKLQEKINNYIELNIEKLSISIDINPLINNICYSVQFAKIFKLEILNGEKIYNVLKNKYDFIQINRSLIFVKNNLLKTLYILKKESGILNSLISDIGEIKGNINSYSDIFLFIDINDLLKETNKKVITIFKSLEGNVVLNDKNEIQVTDCYKKYSIKNLEFIYSVDTKKNLNYLPYYSYILLNYFNWELTKNGLCGKPISKNIDYSIIYSDRNLYKITEVNEKGFNCIQSDNKMLNKKEILESAERYSNFNRILNKLFYFLKPEQILFWDNKEYIEIDLIEYNLQFKLIKSTNKLIFNNYEIQFTNKFINITGNISNLFVLYYDDKYYILNIVPSGYLEDKYNYDILELHYSNTMIMFKNDIDVKNYIQTVRKACAGYLIHKMINKTIQKLYKIDEYYTDYKGLYDNYILKILKNEMIYYGNKKESFHNSFKEFHNSIIFKINPFAFSSEQIKYHNIQFILQLISLEKINVPTEIISSMRFIPKFITYYDWYIIDKVKRFNYGNKEIMIINLNEIDNKESDRERYYYSIESEINNSDSYEGKYSHYKEYFDNYFINAFYGNLYNLNKEDNTNTTNSIQKLLDLYKEKLKLKGGMGGMIEEKLTTSRKVHYTLDDYKENEDKVIDDSYQKIILSRENIKPDKNTIIITNDDLRIETDIMPKLIYYNDKVIDIFFNSNEFRKQMIISLIKKSGFNLNENTFIKTVEINTTKSFMFYQFYLGGFLRDNQIETIVNILKDYTFENNLLSIIENTYNPIKIEEQLFNSFEDKSFKRKNNRKIYNLIMGAGKTKMITPLILLYIYEYITTVISSKKLVLVFPEKLIEQSYKFLTYYLGFHFDIDINLQTILTDDKINIISDVDLKKQIVNLDNNLLNIFSKNNEEYIVLMDEADMIIDPISSELNVPSSQKIFLNKTIYSELIDICFELVKLTEQNKMKMYLNEKLGIPYIEFKNNIKNIKNITDTNKLNKDNYILYDSCYNIENNLETIVNMVNRKDFGFNLQGDEIITPFQFSETPIKESEFNDIFINLLLTIKSYNDDNKISFVKLYRLIRFIIEKISTLKPNKYIQNEHYIFITKLFEKYELPNIIFMFNIPNDQNSLDNLQDALKNINLYDKIEKLLSDEFLRIYYCKNLLYEHLYYYSSQLNISGINLVNSNIFNYISGFTGTPESRFKFLDPHPLNILDKNDNSISLEAEAIKKNCDIINYDIPLDLSIYTEKYDYIPFIISNMKQKYNAIIDVGGLFINKTINELVEIIFQLKYVNRLIFIDKDDKFYTINKNNIYQIIKWDYSIFDDDLIFFDNSHTTGIDLTLKDNFRALIPLRQNTRYRDFIQGLYRMRKINLNQKADIIMMPNVFSNKAFEKIDKKTINGLVRIININEEKYFQNQMFYFNLQNLRQIKPLYMMNSDLKGKPFEIENELVKVTNSYDEYKVNKTILNINKMLENFTKNETFINKYISLNKENINKMKDNLFKYITSTEIINLSIQTQIQTQTEILEQIQINLQTSIYSDSFYGDQNIFKYTSFDIETYEKYFDDNYIVPTKKIKHTFKLNDYELIFSKNILEFNKGYISIQSKIFNLCNCAYIVIPDKKIIKIDNIINLVNLIHHPVHKELKYMIYDVFGNYLFGTISNDDILTRNLNLFRIFLISINMNYYNRKEKHKQTDVCMLNYRHFFTYDDMNKLFTDKEFLDQFIRLFQIYETTTDESNIFDIRDMDIRIIFIYIIALCKNIKSFGEFSDIEKFNKENLLNLYRRSKEIEVNLKKLTDRLNKKFKLDCDNLNEYNLIKKCLQSILTQEKYINKLSDEDKISLQYLTHLLNVLSNFPIKQFKEDKIFEQLDSFIKQIDDEDLLINNKILYDKLYNKTSYDY